MVLVGPKNRSDERPSIIMLFLSMGNMFVWKTKFAEKVCDRRLLHFVQSLVVNKLLNSFQSCNCFLCSLSFQKMMNFWKCISCLVHSYYWFLGSTFLAYGARMPAIEVESLWTFPVLLCISSSLSSNFQPVQGQASKKTIMHFEVTIKLRMTVNNLITRSH